MSILLPEIDEAIASRRLRSLEMSIQELETSLEELSSRRRILQNRRSSLDQAEDQLSSIRRRSLLAFQLTSCVKKMNSGGDLKDVNEALQNIDTRLQNMLQRHRRLSFSLEIYREILAPITRIPYEILEQIFLYTLPSGFVKPNVQHSPLLLTMVCRKWRSLAFSTPYLWSSLSTTSDWPLRVFSPGMLLSPNDTLGRIIPKKPPAKLTLPSQPQLWIERAREKPFHMEITIPKKDCWFGINDPYFHWVVQTSQRWFHLRLTARSINLSLLLSKPMPRLVSLELIGVYDRSYDIFMLRTHYAEFNLRPNTFSFPWNSLTTFEASETWIIVDQLIVILNGSPNLRSCRAKIQDLYTIHDEPYLISSRTTHPSLVSFHISMNDRDGYPLRRLLDSLILTSLTTLHATTLNEPTRSNWPHAAFIKFIRRSQCPLQKLHLAGFSMFTRADEKWRDPKRLDQIRQNLPMLRSFEFV